MGSGSFLSLISATVMALCSCLRQASCSLRLLAALSMLMVAPPRDPFASPSAFVTRMFRPCFQ